MKYFFLAGYVKYSHYITYYLMEMPRQCWFSLMDIGVQLHQISYVIQLPLELAKWCQRHTTICWFGKWVYLTRTVSDWGGSIYSGLEHGLISQKLHKAKMKYRQALDFWSKNIRILCRDNQPHLSDPFYWSDCFIRRTHRWFKYKCIIDENVESNFIVSLHNSFYKAISILIQRMCMVMGQTQGTQSN